MRFKDLEINSSKLARPGCEHLDQKEKNTHTPKKRLKEGQHQPKQKNESDKKSGKALAVGLIVLVQVCEPLAAEHLLKFGDAGLASAKVGTITPVPPIRGPVVWVGLRKQVICAAALFGTKLSCIKRSLWSAMPKFRVKTSLV